MTTSIAEYFIDEIGDWTEAIDFHLQEMDESEEWLKGLLDNNTIPNLAARVEHFLSLLQLSRQNLVHLHGIISSFEKKFQKNQIPVANEAVSSGLMERQGELRKSMHFAELDYIRVKYACDEFIADTFTRQAIKKNNAPS